MEHGAMDTAIRGVNSKPAITLSDEGVSTAVSSALCPPMEGTLIHEMAHAATSGEHDQEWLHEMVR